jgi:hypothetical protein
MGVMESLTVIKKEPAVLDYGKRGESGGESLL